MTDSKVLGNCPNRELGTYQAANHSNYRADLLGRGSEGLLRFPRHQCHGAVKR